MSPGPPTPTTGCDAEGWDTGTSAGLPMSLDQLKAFMARLQSDAALKQQVLAAATADDVAQVAMTLGFEFSGDELLRVSGQRFDRVTVRKNDIPGEYN